MEGERWGGGCRIQAEGQQRGLPLPPIRLPFLLSLSGMSVPFTRAPSVPLYFVCLTLKLCLISNLKCKDSSLDIKKWSDKSETAVFL